MPQLTTRESATIAQESGLILDEVRDLTITDQHSYDRHIALVRQADALTRKIKDTFDPICQSAHKAPREAVHARDVYLKPLVDAKKMLTKKCADFEHLMEMDQKNQKQESLLKAKEEDERRRLKDAAMAAKMGESEALINAILNEQRPLNPDDTQIDFVRAKGVVRKTPLRADVINFEAFVRWIGTHPEYMNLVKVNQAALNQLARSGALAHLKVDGVKIV